MMTNDKDIIYAMREDAERGFRLLMQSYKEPLYWHIRRLVVSHDDAQDAAQEAFIRIFRSFGQYNEVNSLRAWLFRIATNEALRLIERRHEDSMPIEKVFDIQADSYINYGDLEAVRLQNAIRSLLAIAAAVALFFVVQPTLTKHDTISADDYASVELAFNNLSSDDQDFLIAVYENEEFINVLTNDLIE